MPTEKHALGPLEMRVVGLFEGQGTCSVADVKARLEALGERVQYTTVMTVLSRLAEKGVLTRKRDGKRFLYRLSRSAPARASGVVERVHRALFKAVRARPIAALLDTDDLSTEELRELKRLVDEKLKARSR